MLPKRATIADIAEQAGVSKGAAAKVLNGTINNIRVGKEKADIIRKIAINLNYQPNFNARALAGRESKVIGILIDSEAPAAVFRTLSSIEKQATAHGYRIMIGESHNSAANLIANYQNFQQYGVDGIIAMAHDYPDDQEKIANIFQWSANTVTLGKTAIPNVSSVIIERGSTVMEAVRLMRERGRQRLGMVIGNDTSEAVKQRIEGFQHAGGEQIFTIPCNQNAESIQQNVVQIMKQFIVPQKLDGIMLPNDFYAAALFRELPHNGLAVPRDLSVIGNDNEPFAQFLMPSLATIDENSEVQAVQAVNLLVSMLNERQQADSGVCRQVTVKTKLIVRESL